jgi:hypothetical protein
MPRRPTRIRARDTSILTLRYHSAPMGSLIDISDSAIIHMPPHMNILCPNFSAADPLQSCPFGFSCSFIHADTIGECLSDTHMNYAWRRLQDVSYVRFPAGMNLKVTLPRGRDVDVMSSCMMLETGCLSRADGELRHCANYYFHRKCAFGRSCRFVHAVYINPHATEFELAPYPVVLGRFGER